jgi:hypothetical protein
MYIYVYICVCVCVFLCVCVRETYIYGTLIHSSSNHIKCLALLIYDLLILAFPKSSNYSTYSL